ncbi:MAG: preprotein translocase subunit YajC [Candidatus Omnitrophica bacterium]|nr:preprotein translocase subunit YajC [Candidatus Omnitrophota bacterium]
MYPVLAQVQSAQQPTWGPFIVMGLIFVIFYVLIIKPQKQKEVEHQKMLQALNKNDEVVTIGGIYGTIINVKDNAIVLRIADNVKIEVQKSAIAGLRKTPTAVVVEPKA